MREDKKTRLKRDCPPVLCFLKGEYEGEEISLESGQTIRLGRNPAKADLIFKSTYISSLHCSISFDEDTLEFLVTDHSINGIFTEDGVKLERDITTRLPYGTEISLSKQRETILLGTKAGASLVQSNLKTDQEKQNGKPAWILGISLALLAALIVAILAFRFLSGPKEDIVSETEIVSGMQESETETETETASELPERKEHTVTKLRNVRPEVETESETVDESETEIEMETESETETESELETECEIETESELETECEIETECEVETESEAETESETEKKFGNTLKIG